MKGIKLGGILAVFFMALFSYKEVSAEDRIVIKPKITISSEMDSNFYKAENEEREVYTFLVQPGIIFGYETGKSSINLDYTLNAAYYNDNSEASEGQKSAGEDDYLGHIVVLSAKTKPFDRLTLGLEDAYYKTRDPGQADRFSNSVEREKYSINRLTPMVLYEFGNRFSLGVRYRNTLTDYERNDAEDSTEHRGICDLIYRFTRTAALDLEYQHWNRDYDHAADDYTSDQMSLIFRKQFKYFYFEAGGGYHQREFDDIVLEDQEAFTYRFAAKGQFPPAPDPRPSSFVKFVAERNFNDSGIGNNYFKGHQFSLEAGHIFMGKILGTVNADYKINDYVSAAAEGSTREDDTYGLSLGAGYLFKEWLTFKLSGGYEKRDSNLNGYSYDNKYAMATVEFNYDLSMK